MTWQDEPTFGVEESLDEQGQDAVLEKGEDHQDGEEGASQDADPFQVMLDDGIIRIELFSGRRTSTELGTIRNLSFTLFTHDAWFS